MFKPGGHENFAKMIDEAEVLEFPMVVKNTRGHRGVYELLLPFIMLQFLLGVNESDYNRYLRSLIRSFLYLLMIID